jgi:c(7)-type cytochrome triheme protein
MRHVIAFFATVTFVGSATVAAQDQKPRETIVFPATQGEVTFLHAKHIERENGDCAGCHDKLWTQTTEPLKNSQGCHTCHKPDGKAFSARDRSNCERCHPVGADKTSKKP